MRKKKKSTDASTNGGVRRSLYELPLSLSLAFWCLVFLIYSRFSHGNRDSYSDINGSNNHWKEMLLESFLFSTSNASSTICKSQDFHYPNREINGVTETTYSKDVASRQQEDVEEVVSLVEQKIDTSTGVTYSGLDEFRNRTLQRKKSGAHNVLEIITHRLEPGGTEYNYASSLKGAKVLAHNKEAKGVGNILGRDKDKYLRNPCSVDRKFVVIELSEETLVDAIEIANLEHYSSNYKDFELSGSLSYPSDTWVPLGTFSAENAKHAQRFMLPEPKWMRYMKLNLVSHYRSEFYCTLSFVEVYGVDAIERMLEDLIVVSDKPATDQVVSSKMEHGSSEKDVTDQVHGRVDFPTKGVDIDDSKNEVHHPVKEVRQQVTGRIPSDTVLKILMQKMRSLELNLSILEEYIKELDRRYGNTLPDLQKELSQNVLLVEKTKSEIIDLMEWKEAMEKEFGDLEHWKPTISAQVDALVGDNAFLRANAEKIRSNQEVMENKELAVLSISLFFACLALFKLICDWILMLFRTSESERICRTSTSWLLVLASSSMATLITLLYD